MHHSLEVYKGRPCLCARLSNRVVQGYVQCNDSSCRRTNSRLAMEGLCSHVCAGQSLNTDSCICDVQQISLVHIEMNLAY